MKTKRVLYICIVFFLGAYVQLFAETSNVFNAGGALEFVLQERSAIKITSPTASTVWTLPNRVSLEWTTENISDEKNIRFFLIRDEMVVQELGIFKNTGNATDITLEKNIGKGNTYKVMAIELFPEDKYNIAKHATAFFAIDKPDRIVTTATTENRDIAMASVVTEPVPAAPIQRAEFAGRNISYVKDLVFKSPNITIYVWDHGREDGDIVSIYLNGNPVLSKHNLTYSKKEIKIKIDPTKKNDLFLYAHNLGTSPPNTVSIKVTDGTTSENIIFNSDLKSCEAVVISVTE